LAQIAALAVAPAWRDVWICLQPTGHLQAVGTDARGRRQYLYHEQWRADRDRVKHERVLRVPRRLPGARTRVAADLAGRGLTRDRVLACVFRLLDLGFFRVGGEDYAEENGTFGLSTLRREHVVLRSGGRMTFDYVAKSGIRRTVTLHDPAAHAVVSALARRQGSHDHLFAYRVGARWHDVTGADINEYVRERLGDATAKDFRTWHATVLAAVALAVSTPTLPSRTARARAVARAMREVSTYLGNTPAVCRASYVDARVVDRFHDGRTVEAALRRIGEGAAPDAPATQGALERAVLRLLAS
jgi:DNA topoisomerase IB